MTTKPLTDSIGLIIVSILCSAGGQLALKLGMGKIGAITVVDSTNLVPTLVRMFSTPLVLVGLACYGLAALLWMVVLSRLDLSLAYPMVALLYVVIPIAAWLFLGEQVPWFRWVGILVVVLGIFIISRT